MILSYKYRLYPNKKQRQTLGRILEIHRQLYNDALTERRLAWKMKRVSITYLTQANQLKAIRKFDEDAAFVNYSSVQQTLRRLQKSFDAFFRRLKAGEKPGYPRYKGKGWFKSVGYVYGDGLRLKGDRLYVQRVGEVRMFQHRPLPNGTIKQVILKRDRVGNWHAVFQVELPDIEPASGPTQSVGIDMGLEVFAALSTGEMIDNPRWFRVSEKKLAILQRKRSRCKKGGCQYRELTRQIGKLHEKIANQRRDFHHKLSRKLVDQYGLIFVESLNVHGLCQSQVSKSMADAGWSQFLFFTRYKAENAGRARPEVDAKNTSQLCPMCGCLVKKSLSIRVHHCPNCGYTVARDVASAQVIELRGLNGLGQEPRRKVLPSFSQNVGSAEAPGL
jgi:putative transposase